MDVWVYVVNSAAWSAAGFGAGWLLSRMTREVHDLHESDGGNDD